MSNLSIHSLIVSIFLNSKVIKYVKINSALEMKINRVDKLVSRDNLTTNQFINVII